MEEMKTPSEKRDTDDFFEHDANGAEKDKPAASIGSELLDWADNFVSAFMCVIIILTFFVRMNDVSGISMQPTLYDGERLLVWQFGYTPQYGDIVIIQAENLPNGETGEMGEGIVKRVIGVGGDVIDIDRETGVVYRNGEALQEDYIAETIRESRRGNADYPLTVEENTVFVLGDNRNNSTDSRWVKDMFTEYYVGCVDLKYVVGKAFFRVYPFDRMGGL